MNGERKFNSFFTEKGIDKQHLQIETKRATGTASVRLNEAGIPAFVIEDEAAYDFIEVPPDFEKEIELFYFGTLAQRSVVSRNTLQRLSSKARRCFLDVNLRQRYYSLEMLRQSFVIADIVKLNLEELQTIHPLFFSEPFELEKSARLLLKKFSLSHVAVTLGEEGSWLFMEDDSHFYQTKATYTIDTVGAGDGFSAMMCLGILRGLPLAKIHESASEFSAAVCGVKGALPVDDGFYASYKKVVR